MRLFASIVLAVRGITVVAYILGIAILNLAVGFGTARFVRWRAEVDAYKRFVAESESPEETDQAEQPPSMDFERAGPAAVAPIPSEWMDFLQQQDLKVNSFVEAAATVLKLHVAEYRGRLVEIEGRIREESPAGDSLAKLRDELVELNEDWSKRQLAAAEEIETRSGQFGNYGVFGKRLEQVLTDQIAQIEATCENLNAIDLADADAARSRMLLETGRLVDLAHALRDRMQETAAVILRTENRLEEIDEATKCDELTQLRNRVGMETVLNQWWSDDTYNERIASVACVDVDRFARINEKHGTLIGDRVLMAVGGLLQQFIGEDHAFDVGSRFSGQTFMLLFEDTGPRNAMSASERIRQSIEATTFQHQGDEFDLSVSCGVTDYRPDDTADSVVERAKSAINEAKKAGRNRTGIDEGDGPSVVDPPQYQVRGCVVQIDNEPQT